MRVALYTVDSWVIKMIEQERLLRAHAESAKMEVVAAYTDVRTWTHSTKKLEGLNRLLKGASERKFDHLLVADISFLGLSLQHLFSIVDYLETVDVKVDFLNQQLSTAGIKGRGLVNTFRGLSHFVDAQAKDRLLSLASSSCDETFELPAVFRKTPASGFISPAADG